MIKGLGFQWFGAEMRCIASDGSRSEVTVVKDTLLECPNGTESIAYQDDIEFALTEEIGVDRLTVGQIKVKQSGELWITESLLNDEPLKKFMDYIADVECMIIDE